MKRIALSQRQALVAECNETRDCIDQAWYTLCKQHDCLPTLILNDLELLASLLEGRPFDGIILTGGNTLVKYGGDAPVRDRVEKQLMQYATENSIPVLGVCRGMQFINDFFGGTLRPCDNHIATAHPLLPLNSGRVIPNDPNLVVNSFHDMCIDQLALELSIIYESKDGVAEAIEHKHLPIAGIMWHPERENAAPDAFMRRILGELFSSQTRAT